MTKLQKTAEKWATICNQAVKESPQDHLEVSLMCSHCCEQALRDERKRCAEVARKHIDKDFPNDDVSNQCKIIAQAIESDGEET